MIIKLLLSIILLLIIYLTVSYSFYMILKIANLIKDIQTKSLKIKEVKKIENQE